MISALVLVSCARVGSPVGGHKDTIPPKLIGSNIDTSRVNVPRNLKELRLDFDEYVSLDKITKNLIISPPIKKITKILPRNLANKYVLLQWADTLQANTTYSFNFGNAIKDNNEGNVLRYFNFAFSTGNKIDDLFVSGIIENPIPSLDDTGKNNDKSIVVGLYKNNDSIDYKQKPYYVGVADPDGYYELNFLSPGSYKLLAFEDKNGNGIFDTGLENVAFFKDSLNLEKQNISGKNIRLMPSAYPFKQKEIKENPGGAFMLFQGHPEQLEIKSLNPELQDYKVTHKKFSDSAFIWFDAKKDNIGITESKNLKFSFATEKKLDSTSLFYRLNSKNEMKISNEKGANLPPKSDFVFTSNYVISNINSEKWKMLSDSVTIPFSAEIDPNNPFQVRIKADFKEGASYALTVPKETLSSYYEKLSKSYRFEFKADKVENYGSITLLLEHIPNDKFWIQLLDSKGNIKYNQYTTGSTINFEMVLPGTYNARILVDNNGNGYWDLADLATQTFAEDAFFFDKPIQAKQLWQIKETWDLTAPPTTKSGNNNAPVLEPKEQNKDILDQNNPK